MLKTWTLFVLALIGPAGLVQAADEPAQPVPSLEHWLGPQNWVRDVDHPVVELGQPGQFDDRHLFAPCVARIDGRFLLWYSGSTQDVANRVFSLGLATSDDGRTFVKHAANPVLKFEDGRRSVLTAALLRGPDGVPLYEDGRLRMWFAATDFVGGHGLHTLHESTSVDGIAWSPPSMPLLEHVYAPAVIKDQQGYRMWYTDVGVDPWVLRTASSHDGREWSVRADPIINIDQPWEHGRLFYPYVLQTGGVYLMWYGSYWSDNSNKTALGFAVSVDGIQWRKHPQNPVFRPDPARAWESNYTTSQTVLRLDDGSFRIWYASRKAPPFVNKYFAIGTARWDGP